jgi:hypothetical protein
MWADTFDWTVSRALAAAEKVPWSEMLSQILRQSATDLQIQDNTEKSKQYDHLNPFQE